ncbi:hypothetical protein EV182_006031, partial [Spiromyces aspiralis]
MPPSTRESEKPLLNHDGGEAVNDISTIHPSGLPPGTDGSFMDIGEDFSDSECIADGSSAPLSARDVAMHQSLEQSQRLLGVTTKDMHIKDIDLGESGDDDNNN